MINYYGFLEKDKKIFIFILFFCLLKYPLLLMFLNILFLRNVYTLHLYQYKKQGVYI
jgi:hypothetical protein